MWLIPTITYAFLYSMLRMHVAGQPGFLSLDCGGKENFTDTKGIQWVPDDAYISTGSPALISSEFKQLRTRKYQTLRFFPPLRKHCYALPVTVGKKYLLRPGFFHGKYDGPIQSSFSFDIILYYERIAILEVQNAADGISYYEFILVARQDPLLFCIGSTSLADVPFISILELRLLGDGMYSMAMPNQILGNIYRDDLGASGSSNQDFGYPDDPYDRTWVSDFTTNRYPRLSTHSNVSEGRLDKPPSLVMSTAITNSSIVHTFNLETRSKSYYMAFYFAELTRLNTTDIREFNIFKSDASGTAFYFGPINVFEKSGYLTTLQYYHPAENMSGPTSFIFRPTNQSTLDPVLNAAELYYAIDINYVQGTDSEDVEAINAIKSHFKLLDWSGDPCFPSNYMWTWITCDFEKVPAIISELRLSNFNLTGSIPESISGLQHLSKIYMDNNKLKGSIPDFTPLTSLTHLYLQNNSLSGSIPQSLVDMPSLKELFLQGNMFIGCPPASKSTLKLDTSRNPTSCGPGEQSHKKSSRKSLTLPIAASCAAFVLVTLSILVLVSLKRKGWFFRLPFMKRRISDQQNMSSADLGGKNNFSYGELLLATNDFESKNIVGEGGFGPVYYGKLPNGRDIAVKVLSESSDQGQTEFDNEVDALSSVHHKNLVSLLGSCVHNSKLLLIYEFMSNGTLRDNLTDVRRQFLSWKQRLDIALDVAQGLDYMHNGCNPPMIHRDIKSTNILLNEENTAKISDFGLRVYNQLHASHITTAVKGTMAYLDPDYHITGRLTYKSDVYSFGVVLLEIICGQKPVYEVSGEPQRLLDMVNKYAVTGELDVFVDSRLKGGYHLESMWELIEVAMYCTKLDPTERPTMTMIVDRLKEAMRIEAGFR